MEPLLAFLGTIVFISFIIPRLGPFLCFIIAAIVCGLFTGRGSELMGYVFIGLGRIFPFPAIVVFAGTPLFCVGAAWEASHLGCNPYLSRWND
jgi:hypothetical protein